MMVEVKYFRFICGELGKRTSKQIKKQTIAHQSTTTTRTDTVRDQQQKAPEAEDFVFAAALFRAYNRDTKVLSPNGWY